MAIRNANNYMVAIAPETVYGTAIKNLMVTGKLFGDKLEWNNAPVTAEILKKENSLYKPETRSKIAANLITGTLSGDLTSNHEILLKAHFDDATQPYLYATDLPATKSYTIYQLYYDAAGVVTTYDVLCGAIINPLTITGEANGVIQFSCGIEAATYRQEVANTGTDKLTLAGLSISNTPFLFGNITGLTLPNGAAAINSFSLELQKTMVDNALRFQNSMTKTNDRYIGVGGTLSFTTLWDVTNDAAQQAARYNETAVSFTMQLVVGTVEWTFVIEGVVIDATRPDADRGIFLGNYTLDLTSGGGTGVPITITIT